MESITSRLWRLAGEAIAILFRASPGYEARLTQRATSGLARQENHCTSVLVSKQLPKWRCGLRDIPHRLQAREFIVHPVALTDFALREKAGIQGI